MIQLKAFDEIVDFLVSQSPEKVVDFQASETTRARVYNLVSKEKTSTLNEEEKTELEYYKVLEHIMRLAKAKAYKVLHA